MENIFRNWFSTLFGAVLIVLAGYAWWEDDSWIQVGTPFGGGCLLLFARDSISTFVNQLFAVLIEKIKSLGSK